MIRSAMTLATAGLLAACTAAPPPQPTVARLGADPVVSGGSYDSGGGLSVAVDLRERDGRTMVCGVWAESAQQSILTKNKAKGVLDTASIAVGGETVLRGLRFLAEVAPMAGHGLGSTRWYRVFECASAMVLASIPGPRRGHAAHLRRPVQRRGGGARRPGPDAPLLPRGRPRRGPRGRGGRAPRRGGARGRVIRSGP